VRIGVDLGGTKIEILALDDNGATVLKRRVQTPMGDYVGTVRTIADLASSAQSQIGASATVGYRRKAVCSAIQIALCSMASR
jgi:fructokinase